MEFHTEGEIYSGGCGASFLRIDFKTILHLSCTHLFFFSIYNGNEKFLMQVSVHSLSTARVHKYIFGGLGHYPAIAVWHESSSIWSKTTSMSLLLSDGLAEQFPTLNTVINHSRNGLRQLSEQAGNYFEQMARPVNNFLKDLAEIEREFRSEIDSDVRVYATGVGRIIPIEEAIKGCGEENY